MCSSQQFLARSGATRELRPGAWTRRCDKDSPETRVGRAAGVLARILAQDIDVIQVPRLRRGVHPTD